jgi:hypothetical protein
VCDELDIGFGKVGQPFRLALSGNGDAGSIDLVPELIGKDITLKLFIYTSVFERSCNSLTTKGKSAPLLVSTFGLCKCQFKC